MLVGSRACTRDLPVSDEANICILKYSIGKGLNCLTPN